METGLMTNREVKHVNVLCLVLGEEVNPSRLITLWKIRLALAPKRRHIEFKRSLN